MNLPQNITGETKVSLALIVTVFAILGGALAWGFDIEGRIVANTVDMKNINSRLDRIENKLDMLLQSER